MNRIILSIALLLTLAACAELSGWMSPSKGVDYAALFKKLRPLAEQGNAYAQYDLASLYHRGHGVRENPVAAARLYRMAAEQGITNAQAALGHMYLAGNGVPRELTEAYYWLSLAAKNGFRQSTAFNYVGNLLTPDQITAVRIKVAVWHLGRSFTPPAPARSKQARISTQQPTWKAIPVADAIYCYYAEADRFYSIDIVPRNQVRARKWEPLDCGYGDIAISKSDYLQKKRPTGYVARTPTTTPAPLKRVAPPPTVVDKSPPTIIIPSTLRTRTDSIEVAGRVSDDSKIVSVLVAGTAVPFGKDGSFRVSRYVPPDGDTISIEAVDEWNNRTQTKVRITRTAQQARITQSFEPLNPSKRSVKPNPTAVALIIGVEDYKAAPMASYANRDAKFFFDYARRALGVPRENIRRLVDGEATQIAAKKAYKQWLRGVVTPDASDVYIFFAGHGLASGDGRDLYLLPYDGEPTILEDSALLRDEMFEAIQAAEPRTVTVFLDTCYSGFSRDEEVLMASARPVFIASRPESVPPNFTVFSAASGSQISSGLDEAKHGLFSYFLMKGMEGKADANNDRKITARELHEFVLGKVRRQAIRMGREQTPELVGDGGRVLVSW